MGDEKNVETPELDERILAFQHSEFCESWRHKSCDCGLTDARAELSSLKRTVADLRRELDGLRETLADIAGGNLSKHKDIDGWQKAESGIESGSRSVFADGMLSWCQNLARAALGARGRGEGG